MKRTKLFFTVLILTITATVTSCKPCKVWATKEKPDRDERTVRNTSAPPPPRYYSSAALIISPTPGFVMKRYSDGRYYHRSQQGFMYWKGYDNRFYLDRTHFSRASYSKWEYEQWKRYSRR